MAGPPNKAWLKGVDKINRNTLDKLGPYTAAFGALIGTWIQIIFVLNFRTLLPCADWVLAYGLCTCSHRKYVIYSPGAFGALIGAIIGEIVTSIVWLGVILLLSPLYPYQTLLQFRISMGEPLYWGFSYSYTLQMIFAPLFAFIISRRMCNKARQKNTK